MSTSKKIEKSSSATKNKRAATKNAKQQTTSEILPLKKKNVNRSCGFCGKLFGKEVVWVSGLLYHVECCICFNCKKRIEKQKVLMNQYALFCWRCYKYMYIQRCVGCERPIKDLSKCIKAMDVKWHQKCFRCCLCKKALAKYLILNNHQICIECYESERFSATILARDVWYASPSSRDDKNVTIARPAMYDDEVDPPSASDTTESTRDNLTKSDRSDQEDESNRTKKLPAKFDEFDFL